MKKNLSTRSLNVWQNASNSVLSSSSCMWRSKMPLKGLNFVKTLVRFGIIYAADPLLQNMTKVVCLR